MSVTSVDVATTSGSSIFIIDCANPGSTSAVPTSLRPKVASWTASSCRVPYENTSSVGGLVVDTFGFD